MTISSRKSPEASILFVDDDLFGTSQYVDRLRDAGFKVLTVGTVQDAFDAIAKKAFAAAVVDVMMPPGPTLDPVETAGGFRTGVAVARRLRQACPQMAILGISNMPDTQCEQWFCSQPRMGFGTKAQMSPTAAVRKLKRLMDGTTPRLRIFIVHGRDRKTVLELKDFLQNRLGFDEPIVLDQQSSRGRTIIEKFEHYVEDIDVAFVLLTPDDIGRVSGDARSQLRARQNVIFELGYFLAHLRRRNGTVIVLVKGEIELPSDIRGLVYIDISNGIESAGEQIRRELAPV